MSYPIYGLPLTALALSDMQQNFWWFYEDCNAIQNLPLKTDWQGFSARLGINSGWGTANGDGILMNYMVESDASGPYYSYAIVEAERDGMGQFQPKPGAVWFSLLPGGGIKTYITPAEITYMNSCIAAYVLLYTRNIPDLISSTSVLISTLPNHPLKCFISAETIWKFYSDNSAQIGVNTDLVIYNIASYSDVIGGAPSNQMKSQGNALVFSNSGTDMINNQIDNMGSIYANKGLDYQGRCPNICA